MSRRVVDWTPLCGADPLPGEADLIIGEALRLRRIGLGMRDQIANLRRIADTPDLAGRSVDALRASAADIVVGLEKAVGRHEQIAEVLSRWHGEFTRLQGATYAPLEIAQEARRLRARAESDYGAAVPVGMAGPGPGAMFDYQRAVEKADELLHQARQALDAILDEHARIDRELAALIDDATNDDAEDGRWDNFKDWVDRNKGWIHGLTETLGWIGTAAAVITLAASGPGAIVIIAIATTAGAAAGHGALAAAGNGSKFDLGLDIFALATFGAGRSLGAALKAKQAATRTEAVGAARRQAADASLAANQMARESASRVLADPLSTAWARYEAKFTLRHTLRSAERAGAHAAQGVANLPLAVAAKAERRLAGNIQDPRNLNDIRMMRSRFPADGGVAQAARGADELALAGRTAYLSGALAEATDRSLDDWWRAAPYRQVKGAFKREVGSTW